MSELVADPESLDWDFLDVAPERFRSTQKQVAADYQEHGWVRIPELLPAAAVAALHQRVRSLSERLAVPAKEQRRGREGELLPDPFVVYADPTSVDGLFRRVAQSRRFAEVAAGLLRSEDVRYFKSQMLVKQPQAAGGQPTGLHQDFPSYPFDRSGSIMIWVAMTDVPSQMGSLRFVDGSHRRFGPLGRVARRTEDQKRMLRLIEHEPVSPPLDLRAGDATAHDDLTVHWAPPNATTQDRWSWVVGYTRPDVLYNGAPYPATDGLGLTVDQPLDSERFPLLRGAHA